MAGWLHFAYPAWFPEAGQHESLARLGFNSLHFGQPPGGFGFRSATLTALAQLPSIFSRSGSGPRMVRRDALAGASLANVPVCLHFFSLIVLSCNSAIRQPLALRPLDREHHALAVIQ